MRDPLLRRPIVAPMRAEFRSFGESPQPPAMHERSLNCMPDPTAPVSNRTARAPPTASVIREKVGSSRLKRRDWLESVDEGVEHETRLGGGRVLNHERVADNSHSEVLHSGKGARKGFATHSEL